MSLNQTPSADRVHIGFFGKRNAGKSSVVNAVTGQALSLVSPIGGTTTDPVQKAMELLPLGPVVIIDTPGFDDEGELGALRVSTTKRTLNRVDAAVLVVDAVLGRTAADDQLTSLFEEKKIPYLTVYNKCDLLPDVQERTSADFAGGPNDIFVSALQQTNLNALKERMARLIAPQGEEKRLLGDLIEPGDCIFLVVPIDKAAPKGRLILPQQQTIRDILDSGAMAMVVRDTDLKGALASASRPPSLVVTDSQVFASVSEDTPPSVPLTSFSILMARYKGFLEEAVLGAAAIDNLEDRDRILISEGCTHHRQCDDIGTVKLPRWLLSYTGKELSIHTSSGRDFPEDLSPYRLVIHCGGCMMTEREMAFRRKCATDAGVPLTNYGIAIAHMQGILKRSIEIFPKLAAILDAPAT